MKKAALLLTLLLAGFAGVITAPGQTTAPAATNLPSDNAPVAPYGPVIMPSSSSIPAPSSPPVSAAPAPAPAPTPGTGVGLPAAAAPQEDIDDIRPPFFLLRSWFWLWVALGVLAAVALIVLLWKWLAGRRVLSPKNAYELALEKLDHAHALMREDDPAPYAVAVSETIRTYLGQRFQSTSSRRTTEEFLRQMQQDTATPLAEHRDLLGDFLRACDLVKFARYLPTLAELEEVHQRAVAFVRATKPVAEAENSGARMAPAPVTP